MVIQPLGAVTLPRLGTHNKVTANLSPSRRSPVVAPSHATHLPSTPLLCSKLPHSIRHGLAMGSPLGLPDNTAEGAADAAPAIPSPSSLPHSPSAKPAILAASSSPTHSPHSPHSPHESTTSTASRMPRSPFRVGKQTAVPMLRQEASLIGTIRPDSPSPSKKALETAGEMYCSER
jgi:hypothetical protein